MRFQVPQYIDIEDKLFGQLTFKQVAYIAGGIGAIIGLYILLPWKIVAFIIGVPILGFGLMLAFYHPNNKPFETMIEAVVYYLIRSRVYLWEHTGGYRQEQEKTTPPPVLQSATKQKLKEKSWGLGINSAEEVSRAKQTLEKTGETTS